MVYPIADKGLHYATLDTDMGWVGILGSTRGLQRITLPQRSTPETRQRLGDGINQATWSPDYFEDLIKRLKIYLGGHKTAFPDKLDLTGATAFQGEVWEATRLIPYGETRSYTWVARQIEKPRAVSGEIAVRTEPDGRFHRQLGLDGIVDHDHESILRYLIIMLGTVQARGDHIDGRTRSEFTPVVEDVVLLPAFGRRGAESGLPVLKGNFILSILSTTRRQ